MADAAVAADAVVGGAVITPAVSGSAEVELICPLKTRPHHMTTDRLHSMIHRTLTKAVAVEAAATIGTAAMKCRLHLIKQWVIRPPVEAVAAAAVAVDRAKSRAASGPNPAVAPKEINASSNTIQR